MNNPAWNRLLKGGARYRSTGTAGTAGTNVNISIESLLKEFLVKFPEALPCKGVIHIGAHRCEEKSLYNSLGLSDKHILWIDGNDDLCAQNNNIVNAVISDVDDEPVTFIVTTNDAMSSSILELKEHKVEHPDCLEEKRVQKRTVTLDTLIARSGLTHDAFDMLAMDIQGAELHALKGATQILNNIHLIVTEVNEKELYSGGVLIHDLDEFLSERGFLRVAVVTNKNGWGDAVYVRTTHNGIRALLDTTLQDRKVTVEVTSGLGNRLFQLAFLYAFAKDNNVRPVLARNLIKTCSQHFV